VKSSLGAERRWSRPPNTGWRRDANSVAQGRDADEWRRSTEYLCLPRTSGLGSDLGPMWTGTGTVRLFSLNTREIFLETQGFSLRIHGLP
jgi:hypothetical protein